MQGRRPDDYLSGRSPHRKPAPTILRQRDVPVYFKMSKRLFIGLEVPVVYREALARLDPKIKGLRWLPGEQMHLTLSFVGTTPASKEESLREALAKVRVGAFFLPIKGIGTFGGAQPTVVWAGIGTGHPHLFALHKQLQDAVLQAGLEPDLRSFHPHITIGRAKRISRAVLQPFLRRHAETEVGMYRVTGFALFSSELSPKGASYSVETRWELEQPAPGRF